MQRRCQQCDQFYTVKEGERHRLCPTCNHERQYPSSAPASSSAPVPPSSPPALFGRPTGCIDQLSEVERAAIITLHKIGWTGRDIAQSIKCSEQTVSLWINRWEDAHSVTDHERSGRARCTTSDVDQDIGLYSDQHVNALPKDIVRELELPISARTVRRRLAEIDLHTYVKRHEHAFTELDLRRRISFAEGYSHWKEEEWSRILWSDHGLFSLDYQTREYVIRPPGHGCDEKYIGKTDRLEGAVWLWGCICAKGLGHAELYVDSLDARRYQSILTLNLVSSARQFWPQGQWYFQQDHASPHTAGTSQVWFHNHGIDLMDFPPWSSDLNPIENLWSSLKSRVYAHHPKTMEELEHWIAEEWAATDLNFISHLCLSMPHRLQLLLTNHGHKISY